jgi:uncharacterized protein
VYIHRKLDIRALLKKKSFFLFGPRSTGKTSLIKQQLRGEVLYIDLLYSDYYTLLSARPAALEEIINADQKHANIVAIDEIQRIPALLNEVHRLIESKQIRFLMTGSSARTLRKRGVNLLAGRAWRADIFPLTYGEIPDFDLDRFLLYGGLPHVITNDNPREELTAYVNTYLREEIQAEALVRKVPSFNQFLQMAAISSGKMLNFANIANDMGVSATTVREYYHILEDTLVGFFVPAFTKTLKRKAMSTAKFYLFDLGVRNKLARINTLDPQSDLYGQAFEHFIIMELRAYLSYSRMDMDLNYWQAKNGQEVDVIIGDHIAIEIKATNKPSEKHMKGLKALQSEGICKQYYLVCDTEISRKSDEILMINWRDFLTKLWKDQIIG